MSWLPARSWYVAVHGLLQDTSSSDVIGNYIEERKVRVVRGQRVSVSFDFRRKAAPIEVRIHGSEEQASSQVRVAVRGAPDSLRFVKDGTATLFLPAGKHTLLVAVKDRLFERDIEVRDNLGQSLTVQIARVDEALFSGSAHAVDAYLAGDLLAASKKLEQAGQQEAATLVRATHHRLRGDTAEAALEFEKAGKFSEAADLAKQSPKAERSADLYEKAGDFRQRGRAARRARATR